MHMRAHDHHVAGPHHPLTNAHTFEQLLELHPEGASFFAQSSANSSSGKTSKQAVSSSDCMLNVVMHADKM